MGDDEITNGIREKLERELDSMQAEMKQTNEANKPEENDKDEDAKFLAVMDFATKVATAGINAYASKTNATL